MYFGAGLFGNAVSYAWLNPTGGATAAAALQYRHARRPIDRPGHHRGSALSSTDYAEGVGLH